MIFRCFFSSQISNHKNTSFQFKITNWSLYHQLVISTFSSLLYLFSLWSFSFTLPWLSLLAHSDLGFSSPFSSFPWLLYNILLEQPLHIIALSPQWSRLVSLSISCWCLSWYQWFAFSFIQSLPPVFPYFHMCCVRLLTPSHVVFISICFNSKCVESLPQSNMGFMLLLTIFPISPSSSLHHFPCSLLPPGLSRVGS